MLRRLYRASPFARLNAVDWSQLHAKTWGAAWAVVLFALTPRVLGDSLGPALTWTLCAVMLLGSVISSAGLVMAARHPVSTTAELRESLPRTVAGLLVEAVGVGLMLTALSLYTVTQFALVFGPAGDQRISLVVFCCFVSSMVVGRLVSVLHRRRKEIRTAKTAGVDL